MTIHLNTQADLEDAIHALVARKVKAGETEAVEPVEEAPAESNVVDLSELLRSSLAQKKGAAKGSSARKAPARKRA